jgi:hypothetical protein
MLDNRGFDDERKLSFPSNATTTPKSKSSGTIDDVYCVM